jgi:hypothetical protein
VDKDVGAASVRLDEAVAFGGVEPFDGSGGHMRSFRVADLVDWRFRQPGQIVNFV